MPIKFLFCLQHIHSNKLPVYGENYLNIKNPEHTLRLSVEKFLLERTSQTGDIGDSGIQGEFGGSQGQGRLKKQRISI